MIAAIITIAGIEPDPIPAIAIVTIVTIAGIVNSDVSIAVIADRFFSDRSDRNDQMDTRLYSADINHFVFSRN